MIYKFAVFAAAAALLASSPAAAQKTRSVNHADLDLSREAGITRLDRRIAIAVRAVCSSGDRSLRALAAQRKCRQETVVRISTQRQLAIAAANRRLAGAPIDVSVAGR